MRVLNLIFGLITVVMLLFVLNARDNGIGLQDGLNSLKNVENATRNLTVTFNYTSPYNENITIKQLIYNYVNGILYSLHVEVNTLIATVLIVSYRYIGDDIIISLFKLLALWVVLWILVNSAKPLGIIYVFIEDKLEKKGKNINGIWILLMSLGIWIGLILLIIFLIYFIY